ncbi:MAG: hypothetical protein J7L62_06505 [Candidatus Aminicenantes bacterium]|nr:hypothetical protein [Candidatus Aminicenantes bacterium]
MLIKLLKNRKFSPIFFFEDAVSIKKGKIKRGGIMEGKFYLGKFLENGKLKEPVL